MRQNSLKKKMRAMNVDKVCETKGNISTRRYLNHKHKNIFMAVF